jgi:hypothetical protein
VSLNAFIALHNGLGLPVFVQHRPAIAVALVLANAASDDGFEFCAVDTLAARASMSRASFQLHLQHLKAAGWVENVPARKQPKWVREKVGGTRIAVRRVPNVPMVGTPEVPMVGTPEVPMVGRCRNLKRGTTSPDGRDSRNPDGRDTDPACAPAYDLISLEQRSTQRSQGGAGGNLGLEQVESKLAAPAPAPLSKPATPKRAPKAQPAFLLEVVEALLPGVVALHGRTFGSPPTAKQAQGYRDRVASCVQHHDRGEQAVRARAAGLDAVLRWWELPHRDTVPRGAPSCWWSSPTPKALLPVHADQLDSLIGHARTGLEQAERAKSMNTNTNSGRTGVYRQPAHYEDVTGMNNPETWQPSREAALDAIGPDPAKARKGGG